MEWNIQPRLGNRVGIGIIMWLVSLDAVLIWIAAQLPTITVITFILVLLALASLPIIAPII